jgi:hypothetical protein
MCLLRASLKEGNIGHPADMADFFVEIKKELKIHINGLTVWIGKDFHI